MELAMTKNQTVVIIALLTAAGTALAAPRESRNAPVTLDVPADPASNTFALAFTGSDAGGPYTATRIRFNGTMTASAAGTYAFDTIVIVEPPVGVAIAYRLSENYAEYVSEVFDVNYALGGSVSPAGTWDFTLTDDFQDGAGGAAPESVITDMVVTLDDAPIPAPTATDLGTLSDGVPANAAAALGVEEVKWYTFTNAECTGANFRGLTIATATSEEGADSEIGLYTTGGLLLANNDDFGGALTSQLSFGSGGVNGDLPAGQHYLAVGSFDTVFNGVDFGAESDGAGGAFDLTVSQAVAPPVPGTWSEMIDGGGDAGQTLGGAQTIGGAGDLPRIVGSFGANDVDIYKLSICDLASFSASTQGTLPAIDTQLFLFDANGTGVVMDDDNDAGAGGTWSMITGASGLIPATGNYFLAVSRYDIDPVDGAGQALWADMPFAAQRAPDGPGAAGVLTAWEGANAATGSYQIDLVGACRVVSGGGQCGAADIGGTGGTPGADNHLDNNDFVVFIDYFFGHNAAADLGSTGGVQGSDGVWDNNDFVVFIDYFFNAPASCR